MNTNGFKNLIFEGGGVKGIAYGGALLELDHMKIMENIERVAGTSAGAINATLLAIGCTANETNEIIRTTHFSDFADGSSGIINYTIRFFRTWGIHKGSTFKQWMEQQIEAKTGKRTTTFAELRAMASKTSGPARMRDLHVVVSNLTLNRPQIFNADNSPDVAIAEAVRMSMSIPFYYRCVTFGKDDIMVDGGVIYNYPIDIFDNTRYLSNPANGTPKSGTNQAPAIGSDAPCLNHETLGFRLGDARDEQSAITSEDEPQKIDSLFTYATALVTYMRENAQKLHLKPEDWTRTVYIDSSPAKVTEFDLSQKQIDQLVANGKTGAQSYFKWALGPDGPQLPV